MKSNGKALPIGFVAALAAAVVASSCFLGSVNAVSAIEVRHDDDEHFVPTGRGRGVKDPTETVKGKALQFATQSTNGINYHGGPVMLGTVNVYYIWYGTWTNNTATTILTTFASYVGATPYFNINKTYYNAANQAVTGRVTFVKAINDPGSLGTSLSDSSIQTIVTNAISSGALPKDANGVYFVLTSQNIKETSGFCTQYCGWHTRATILGTDIKFSFVGNPDQCPSACAAQKVSPNGNAGADAMASIIAHELSESVTDPDLNAWFDKSGNENADKCAWNFGATQTLTSGAKYMLHLAL